MRKSNCSEIDYGYTSVNIGPTAYFLLRLHEVSPRSETCFVVHSCIERQVEQ